MKILICYIFGHKYYLIKKINRTTRKVGCKRCGKMWGMNDDVRALVEWDSELEEFYREFGSLVSGHD
jgi:hypothetical protein